MDVFPDEGCRNRKLGLSRRTYDGAIRIRPYAKRTIAKACVRGHHLKLTRKKSARLGKEFLRHKP